MQQNLFDQIILIKYFKKIGRVLFHQIRLMEIKLSQSKLKSQHVMKKLRK